MKIALPASLLLAAAASSAAAADTPWNAPFTIQVGGFRADASTTVRLDSTTRNAGTQVSFEGDLGMTRTKTLPDLEFLWRINDRHAIEASWVSLNRTGTRPVSGEIHWGDAVFPVNAQIDSKFDSEVIRATYRYSFYNDRRGNEASILLGVHYTTVDTSLSNPGGTISQSASVNAPLPTIGLRGSASFLDTLRVTGYFQALKVKIGDYDGDLVNGAVGLEWAFLPQAYAGVGYNYYKYRVDSEKERSRGRFEYRFDGPTVYAAWTF